jgi:hypothetical protein
MIAIHADSCEKQNPFRREFVIIPVLFGGIFRGINL